MLAKIANASITGHRKIDVKLSVKYPNINYGYYDDHTPEDETEFIFRDHTVKSLQNELLEEKRTCEKDFLEDFDVRTFFPDETHAVSWEIKKD